MNSEHSVSRGWIQYEHSVSSGGFSPVLPDDGFNMNTLSSGGFSPVLPDDGF